MQTDVFFNSKDTDIQSFLLSYSWVESGRDFFQSLAEYLAKLLDADYICIDKLHGNLDAETVAIWFDGHFDDNYRYRLTDTPCGVVVANEVCTVPQNVSVLFPKDKFLQEMGAESYAGITLRDSYGRPIGLIAVISRRKSEHMALVERVLKQVAIRASAELEHRRTIRAFEGMALSDHAIVNAKDETMLMQQVCKNIIKYCDYSLMWIGYVNQDEAKTITPVASAGFEEGYLERLKLTWADTERGRGPTGTAARVGVPVICSNIQVDPNFAPWRKDAIERGYASNMALPLIADGKIIGVVSLYAASPDFFQYEELQLMTRFCNDLSSGIMAIRMKAERDRHLHELFMANELLEVMVSERTQVLTETNQKLLEEIENRKKNEKLLQQTEQKYRTVADFTYDCESWLGTEGRFLYVSPSCEHQTGYKPSEFIENSSLFYEIVHPDDRDIVKGHFDHVIFPNTGVCNLKYRIITKEGKVKWIGHTCQPVFSEDGEWLGQRGSNRDITAEKEAEHILIRSQKQLRALTIRLDESTEAERKRIAGEIHDELGHLLTALKFELDNLSESPSTTIGSLTENINDIQNLVSSLITSVRKISTELRPEIIDHLGLLAALEWQIKEFRKRTRICCDFRIDEFSYNFSNKETTVIFRILQEVLTNISRHANPTHVLIFIARIDNQLVMKVNDNGKGFESVETLSETSLGLLGMKERALSIGASVDIMSTPGKGTEVLFKLPLKRI